MFFLIATTITACSAVSVGLLPLLCTKESRVKVRFFFGIPSSIRHSVRPCRADGRVPCRPWPRGSRGHSPCDCPKYEAHAGSGRIHRPLDREALLDHYPQLRDSRSHESGGERQANRGLLGNSVVGG